MKREGRQHGMVRSYRILPSQWNPRPDSRIVNRFDSPPTAGLFTKVSPKPTNHSKFTGKCGRTRCTECHMLPASKSKDKAKGTQKLRSSHSVSIYRLVTWRVVDSKPGFKFTGFSASAVLDDLAGDCAEDYDCTDEFHEGPGDFVHDGLMAEIEDKDDDDENDKMGFCDVALVWDREDEDEGWCLVGET